MQNSFKDFIEKCQKDKIYRKNAETLTMYTESPFEYLEKQFCNVLANQNLPKIMQNNDSKHEIDRQKLISKIIFNSFEPQIKQKAVLLKNYEQETPRNKLSIWGVLFDVMLNFFEQGLQKKIEKGEFYVSKDKFASVPKRYHSVARPTKHKSGFVFSSNKHSADYTMTFPDIKSIDVYENLLKRAQKLIPLLYKSEFITKTNNGHVIFGPKPVETERDYKISDDQLDAVQQLKKIFLKMAEICLIVPHRNNAKHIVLEYNHEKNNQNIILKTQRHIRTLSQTEISANKNKDILSQEYIEYLKAQNVEFKKYVMQYLKTKISTNIQ